jgi:hypothetical protein
MVSENNTKSVDIHILHQEQKPSLLQIMKPETPNLSLINRFFSLIDNQGVSVFNPKFLK